MTASSPENGTVVALLVTVHGFNKPTVKSPVKPASPGGTTRILLPVNDESDRGRKPVLRDELAVVASTNAYPREQLRFKTGNFGLLLTIALMVEEPGRLTG